MKNQYTYLVTPDSAVVKARPGCRLRIEEFELETLVSEPEHRRGDPLLRLVGRPTINGVKR